MYSTFIRRTVINDLALTEAYQTNPVDARVILLAREPSTSGTLESRTAIVTKKLDREVLRLVALNRS